MSKKNTGFSALIMAELQREGYNPRRSKELAKDLGITKEQYPVFRERLRSLQREDKITKHGGRWTLFNDSQEKTILGVIHIARDGYGFLIPEDTSREDVFVPIEYLGSALNGDKVSVSIERGRGRDYRQFGKVVEVIERGSPRIVAIITDDGMARPEDPKNPYDYEIIDSKDKIKTGHKVIMDITRWPGEGGEPQGKIVDLLGPAGAPDTETAAILASYAAPGPFPEPVKTEVRNIKRPVEGTEHPDRLDLRKLVTFTIDPDTAKDFDDALSCEVREDGTIVAGVHIADVSYFVKPDSRLDEEARERGTSIYLPGRVIPMLPEELSSDMCSLRPNEDHFTKTVFLHYDEYGNRLQYHIHRSVIRSHKRFTYNEAKELLSNEEKATAFEDQEVIKSLKAVYELAKTLREKRLNNDCIELNLPEMKVIMDENGHAIDIVEEEHDFSHQLVEDLMLAANVALAEWCHANGMPVLHRIHEAPSEEDIEELSDFLTASGYPFKAPLKRHKLNAVIEKVRGKPEEHSINLAILKSFRKAVYDPQSDIGHFALNFQHYMHFTSPIRRFPDLHLHQMLDRAFADGADKLPKKLRRKPEGSGTKALASLGTHTSQRERRAMEIEEAVKDFRRLELLSRHNQRRFTAVVTGIRKFGIFVEIREYCVEGMIPKWMVEKKGFSTREESPSTKSPKGTRYGKQYAPGFHLGQEVEIEITKIDLAARICEMELIGLAK